MPTRVLLSLVALVSLSACMKMQPVVPAPEPKAAMEEQPAAEEAMMKKEGSGDAMMKKEDAGDAMMKKDEGDAMMKKEDSGEVMMKKEDDAMMKKEPEQAMVKQQVYAAFVPPMLTDGTPKVLYFHAAWCPKCVQQDKVLAGWYPSEDLAYSVYKIDYDTSAELKQRYGVVQQHTYVMVDGQGKKLKSVSFPGDAALQTWLQS